MKSVPPALAGGSNNPQHMNLLTQVVLTSSQKSLTAVRPTRYDDFGLSKGVMPDRIQSRFLPINLSNFSN
jgi:hypothetical protein